MKDIRILQAKRIISSIVSKTDLSSSIAMITSNNLLVIEVQKTVLDIVPLYDCPQQLSPIAFDVLSVMNSEEDYFVQDNYYLSYLDKLFNIYNSFMNPNNILANEPELRGNLEFERLISLKAADGANFLQIAGNNLNCNYFVPIFSGFPSINKSDKIGIQIYNLDIAHVVVVMNIFKKKLKREYKMCFRILKM